jgi:hypothetical protein
LDVEESLVAGQRHNRRVAGGLPWPRFGAAVPKTCPRRDSAFALCGNENPASAGLS